MRVLVATDGSTCAALAIELVAALDWPQPTTIRVVEVIEKGAGLFGGPWPAVAMVNAEEIEAEVLRDARQTVDQAQRRITRSGVDVEAEVMRGRPAATIADAASSMRADVIVVGSRGHGTIESMVLGSVSAEVVDRAQVPVLVARGRASGPVVMAWDGSICSQAAADLLRRWPIFQAWPVHVVSVVDTRIPWWTGFPEPGAPNAVPLYHEAAEEARRALDRSAGELVAALRTQARTAVAELRSGDAATEIINAARAAAAGLIVIGTHGRTGLSRLVLGSVARNVLHHAPCSVLIVREPMPEGRPR